MWAYGGHRALWDCGVGPMGESMGIVFFICLSLRFVLFWLCCLLSYGNIPMGSMGSYVPAVWDLWIRIGLWNGGAVIYGDLWDDLRGPQVLTRLRSHSYGVKILLWVCDARSMGISSAHAAAVP